jgi:hypothetical protein
MADERCPYAHGPLVVKGPRVDGKHGVDSQGRTFSSIMICPECEHFFAVVGAREIVEVEPIDPAASANPVTSAEPESD